MAENNLSVVLKRKGELSLENRKIPEPLSNEVLIAIHSGGICGSDIHSWKHGGFGEYRVKNNLVLGHESSGTVVKVGDDVKKIKIGDKVCIEPGVACEKCEFCRKGRYNLCPSTRYDHPDPGNGSLCRYYCHNADFCHKLPPNVSLDEGALMEPLAVAVYACKRAGISAGKSVLICGSGAIGLMTLLTCKAMGTYNICVTDIKKERLSVAKKLGATTAICVKDLQMEAVINEVISKLGGRPDVTMECSGVEASVKIGLKVTKPGGTLMMVGITTSEVKLPLIEAAIREVDVLGVYRYVNSFPTALELVASGAVDVRPLITHRFSLEEAVAAFETARSGEGIKVLIQCPK